MYYPVARENELTVSDIDNNPVIAGYVSAAQTIHTFDIKYFQPVYNADSAPVVLRFPRKVIDPGKCVYADCNNRVCVYSNDQQGTQYRFLFLAVIILLICLYIHTDENTS